MTGPKFWCIRKGGCGGVGRGGSGQLGWVRLNQATANAIPLYSLHVNLHVYLLHLVRPFCWWCCVCCCIVLLTLCMHYFTSLP